MKKIYSRLAGVAAVLACAMTGQAHAQTANYPSKPVRPVSYTHLRAHET